MNYYTKQIERGLKLEEIYNKVRCVNPNVVKISPLPEKIVVHFTNLKDLSEARKVAKSVFPVWTDKIGMIWNGVGDNIITSWECTDFSFIELWLECNQKDYPAELLPSKDCTFKERKQTFLYLVCPVS